MSDQTLSFTSNQRDGQGHLNEWTLAMAVRQEAPMSAVQAAHLQQCGRCQEALAVRQQEHAVARTKPMPASLRALLAAPGVQSEIQPEAAPEQRPAEPAAAPQIISLASRARPTRRRWVAAATSLLAAGFVAVLGVSLRNLAPASDGPLAKGGGVTVLASVMRDGRLLLKEQPLNEVRGTRAGDHMRLWVNGAEASSHVVLETLEDEAWVPLFDGPLPQDHALPSGLLLDGNPTHLQLRVCDASDSHCSTQRFDF